MQNTSEIKKLTRQILSDLEDAASAWDEANGYSVASEKGSGAWQALQSAIQNAIDTIRERGEEHDHTFPSEEYFELVLGSLQCVLCDSPSIDE